MIKTSPMEMSFISTFFNSFSYKCVYVSNVILILLCPRYFDTRTILAPFCIKKLAQECLKSCILICFTPANLQYLFFLTCIVVSLNGSSSPKTNQLSLKYFFFLFFEQQEPHQGFQDF